MREGGLPLPLAFQYLILIMISLLASKCQDFKTKRSSISFHKAKNENERRNTLNFSCRNLSPGHQNKNLVKFEKINSTDLSYFT